MKLPIKIKLIVDIVNVGHGDCTIITWENGTEKESWHCIIDSGDGKSETVKTLDEVISERKIKKFNLAILSHFDTDHIGGFTYISSKIKILKYWSPYTPAFENYIWLFGQRGKDAVERAKDLEDLLFNKNVLLESPVDGCSISPCVGLKLSVISPPIKLYEKLLEGTNIEEIFYDYPTFLGDLINSDNYVNKEENIRSPIRGIYSRVVSGVIKRDLLKETEENSSRSINIDETKINKNLVCQKRKIEPEFFGNNILNDTSLVVKIEVWTGTRWYSLLFPGDLENWLYLVAKHPNTLKADFYKATHHGGRVYIGKKEAQDELVQTIRPDVVVISANGRHKLPRNKTRNSLIRWSSTVFCTQKRSCEYFSIDGSIPVEMDCCSDIFNCKSGGNKISFELKQNKIIVNSQSCQGKHSAQGYPIIQFEQHLIPDSKVLTLLSEGEIEQHAKWVVKKLNEIHLERIAKMDSFGSRSIEAREIYDRALQESRLLTMSQLNQVFEYGYSKNKFWAVSDGHRWNNWDYAYKKPTTADLKFMWEFIQSYDILFFNINSLQKGVSSNLLSMHRNLLCDNLEIKTAFPSQLIDSYCWPLLATKFLKGYNGYYIKDKFTYKKDESEWIMIVKYNKNPEEMLYNEISNFYRQNTYQYNDDKFRSYSQKYFNGESNIYVCGTKKGSHIDNDEERKTKLWIYDLLKNYYGNRNDMIIETIW